MKRLKYYWNLTFHTRYLTDDALYPEEFFRDEKIIIGMYTLMYVCAILVLAMHFLYGKSLQISGMKLGLVLLLGAIVFGYLSYLLAAWQAAYLFKLNKK